MIEILFLALMINDEQSSSCAVSPTLPDPIPGLTIVYENDRGNKIGERVINTDGGASEYFKFPVVDGNEPPKGFEVALTTTRINGVIPVSTRNANNSYFRERNISAEFASILPGMELGETKVINSEETSSMNGKSRSLKDDIKVTFLGCFEFTVEQISVPVVRYRVVTSGRTVDRKGLEGTHNTDKVVSISRTHGWWVHAKTGLAEIWANSINE